MKIGIVGSGVLGLAAARRLVRAGHEVTLLERGCEPGGLAITFPFAGTRLEKFYHHFFTTDLNTIQMIKELGLGDKIIWKETPMGVYSQGKLYKFSTPMDLLKFQPLSFFNRIRFGVVTLLLSMVKNWKKYEHTRAESWIKKAYGQQAWDVIWGPLLHGKFGDYASEIGMPWFYSRIHTRAGSRDKSMNKESLGYLEGSFQVMHAAMAQDVEAHGGRFQFNTAIESLIIDDNQVKGLRTKTGDQLFDLVLLTTAPHIILKLLPPDIAGSYWNNLKQIDYYGNVCAVVTLKRSLTPIYWMNIPDSHSPFIAIIEHTNFIDRATYQNKHVLYLSSYLSTEHPRYQADDDKVLDEFYTYLKKVIPSFSQQDVIDAVVFRTPFAQPIMKAGFGEKINPFRSPINNLYVANMAQVYPEDRGMSYSIRLGEQAAQSILEQHQPATSL